MRGRSYFFLLMASHAFLGMASTVTEQVPFIWGLLVVIIGSYYIVRNRNKNQEAAILSAYWVGLEVFFRMSHSYITYESGKYFVITFLLLGLISERKWRYRIPVSYIVFLLLLLPSLAEIDFQSFTEGRQLLLFNLSGPLTLAVSAIYFFRRRIRTTQLRNIIRVVALPMICILVFLAIETPDFSEIRFTSESNWDTSGSYGPNQVSTTLGLGIFFIGLLVLNRTNATGGVVLDVAIVLLLSYRALLTFSRGGVLGAVLALFVFVVLTIYYSKTQKRFFSIFFACVLFVVVGIVLWNYTNKQTGEALEFRYAGRNLYTGRSEDITSFRFALIADEIQLFYNNPVLGVGPGMSKSIRTIENAELRGGTHTEFTRLLAEHGLFGGCALVILLIVPFANVMRNPRQTRPLVLSILVIALFTMVHSAMRLAMPGFLYGLSLISFYSDAKRNFIHRK